jgi:hypothetical protein
MFFDDGPAQGSERMEGRPVGGFVLVSVVQLAMAWWCYRTGAIRFRDLRVWYALWEVRETRCRLKAGREPNYRVSEILSHVGGVGEGSVRSALRRLERIGLARFAPASIEFAISPDELRVTDLSGLFAMLDAIELKGRRVPVPRRTLLLLAGGTRRAVVATINGVLMRCLFAKNATCKSGGRCKASWIAETFGVDLRRAKAARRHLERIGWLIPYESPHWKENRWGRGVVVNLEWSRESALSNASRGRRETPVGNSEFSTSDSPPQRRASATRLPPPCLNQTLPPTEEFKNQKPRSGASGQRPGFSKKEPAKPKNLPPPRLANVRADDLRDTERLLILFEEAQGQGLVSGSENSRLQFLAAAEHAAVIGSTNPPGLFVRLVRRGWWHFATLSDEDAARARLKKFLFGTREPERCEEFEFSNDAELNQCIS